MLKNTWVFYLTQVKVTFTWFFLTYIFVGICFPRYIYPFLLDDLQSRASWKSSSSIKHCARLEFQHGVMIPPLKFDLQHVETLVKTTEMTLPNDLSGNCSSAFHVLLQVIHWFVAVSRIEQFVVLSSHNGTAWLAWQWVQIKAAEGKSRKFQQEDVLRERFGLQELGASKLKHTACCGSSPGPGPRDGVATCCDVLRRVATCCDVLRRVACARLWANH